jgi:hypothetical protein
MDGVNNRITFVLSPGSDANISQNIVILSAFMGCNSGHTASADNYDVLHDIALLLREKNFLKLMTLN